MSQMLYRKLRSRYGSPIEHLTRREVLQSALAASALYLLPTQSRGAAGQRKAGRVVIIGAGFSGLSAAYQLSGSGYAVTVIEARRRHGGRVLSLSNVVPGKVVEGGAELIGANHPTWNTYADTFGLKLAELPQEEGNEPIELGGKLLEESEGKAVWEEVDRVLGILTKQGKHIDPVRPWSCARAKEIDLTPLETWIVSQQASELCKRVISTMFTADGGVSSAWQSLLAAYTLIQGGGGEKYWVETEMYRCAGGNQQLAEKLAEAVTKNGGDIRLATEVKQVDFNRKAATITLGDGSKLEVDDVILTAPPTTWNKINFRPVLPHTLAPQMGTNIKYLVHLKDRVWKKSNHSSSAFSDGPVNQTWEATSTIPGDTDLCLVGFSGADSADVCRGWVPGERQQNYVKLFEQWFPGFGDAVVKAQLMDWPSDQWAKASYSFAAPGQVTSQGPTLYHGIGRLHFAGEYTSYAFPGYMEGALQTGAMLAQRIAARDGIAKPRAAASLEKPAVPRPVFTV